MYQVFLRLFLLQLVLSLSGNTLLVVYECMHVLLLVAHDWMIPQISALHDQEQKGGFFLFVLISYYPFMTHLLITIIGKTPY